MHEDGAAWQGLNSFNRTAGGQTAELPDGFSLMQGIVQQDVGGVVAECGGSAMCATCHVYVDDRACTPLPPIDAVEDEMLDSTASERKPNSRLSCQLTVTPDVEGLVVYLPERQT